MSRLHLKALAVALVTSAWLLATAPPGQAALALSGVGAASPATVAAGGSTLLTVAVTPADTPPSTNVLVVVNLSDRRAVVGPAPRRRAERGPDRRRQRLQRAGQRQPGNAAGARLAARRHLRRAEPRSD